jgi:hypothetical protein
MDPNSCWNKARDDERLFVLLARDPAAPAAIRAWVAERVRIGKNAEGDPQIVEALDAAARVEDEASRINYRPHGGGMGGHDEDATEHDPDLAVELLGVLRRWIDREAPRLRDQRADVAELKIRLQQPQEALDGSLYLQYDTEETSATSGLGGAVPGVPFEAPR